jgi:hypothetical protein
MQTNDVPVVGQDRNLPIKQTAHLQRLVADINNAHAGVGRAFTKAIEHAVAAGRALNEAEDLVPHGGWLPFLKQNCVDLGIRQAQKYMRLARLYDDPTNANSKSYLTSLSIEGAIRQLASARSKPVQEVTAEQARETVAVEAAPEQRSRAKSLDSSGANEQQLHISLEKAITQLAYITGQGTAADIAAIVRANHALLAKFTRIPAGWLADFDNQLRDVPDGSEADDDANQEPLRRRGKPKTETVTQSLHDAVSAAFSELTGLAEECRDIVDNASDGLKQTGRIQTFESTADTLERLDEPTVSPEFADIKVTYTLDLPKRRDRGLSRASRASNACTIINACINALADIKEEDPRNGNACDLANELESAVDEAEGCEFPGMYG